MADNSPVRSSGDKPLSALPTPQLSEREVRKQLLVDLLQDKGSLLPAAIGLIAFLYALLYAPVLGGFFIGLGISIVAVLAGAGVFFWRFVIRYQQNYALKSQKLVALFEAQNLRLEECQLEEIHQTLEHGFSEINAQEGLATLHKLDQEYALLGPVLTSGKATDLLSISSLETLVKMTYLRGISVLADVFELERAVRSTDCVQLQSELSDLQRKVETASVDPVQRALLDRLKERIASNQERLDMVNRLKKRVEELLFQANRCEASLGKTRIELAALKADASDAGVNTVIETLRKTIDRAREVQEELKQMGY